MVTYADQQRRGLIPAADAAEYKSWTESFRPPVKDDRRLRVRLLRKLGLLRENWTGLRANSEKALTMTARAFASGAGEMNRTPDLLITNELLYRLSYTGFV